MIVAVDGPAAAGKGTIARALARHFGFHFLDTGTLYRRVGLALIKKGIEPAQAAAAKLAESIGSTPFRDDELRSESVGNAASIVAAMPEVRAALLAYQRAFARQQPGAVLDGRDIGTVVCPDAEAKIFMTASPEVRAGRRLNELTASGARTDYETVLSEIRARDERDKTRAVAPLKPAPDALALDTSDLTIDEAVAQAIDHVTRKMASSRSGTSIR
jgi:CMP/dCMP kinase